VNFPVSREFEAETGSHRTASSASKSMFLHDFAVQRKMRANMRPLLRAARSPYRKTEDEDPDFGVCLRGPILVSRFHKRSNASKQCRARNNTAIIIVKPHRDRALVRISASESEYGALVGPNAGNALKQTLHGHRSGLATIDDRLNDVGR